MGRKARTGLLVVAYHEAGHAVADWVHGFKLKKVTIIPNANALGSVSSVLRLHFRTLESSNPSGARIGRYHEMIVSLLAGRAAQRPFPALQTLKEMETGNALILSSETEAGSAEEQPAER